MTSLNEIKAYLIDLQQNICTALEAVDGKAKFISDKWTRTEGGGGDTRVISNGNVYEKGGVNFSHVFGKLPEIIKTETVDAHFFDATGVSIVIHTQNPFVPIIHMNVRYFQMKKDENSDEIIDYWFGGGIDLSPAYPNEVDTKFFHEQLKQVCDKHDISYYEKFKTWCDDYFTITHRNEMRGVSGIFYDHLRPNDEKSKTQLFEFMQSVGNAFAPIYTEISNRNKEKSYTELNKEWQMIRRGRYAEFNLVYDRGTTFGLKSNGRVESILMSLPPHAIWQYNTQPETNSEEAKALTFFQPKDWIE